MLNIGADSGRRILVQVSDLTLVSGVANGADAAAGSGGGGGLGAGGAIHVSSRADVVLNNVAVASNLVTGGDAASGVGTGSNGAYGEGGASAGGSGGFAAGDAGASGGGGGAALGGGIFVAEGGGITVSGNTRVEGNYLQAGTGAADGSSGEAAGKGIFLQGSGNLTLRVIGEQNMRINDSIADGAGTGLGSADDSWNLIVSGGGGIPVDTTNPDAGYSYARVDLGAANSFGGDLYVTGADLGIGSTVSLGNPGSMLALDDGGLYLASTMDLDHDVVVNSAGARFGVDTGRASISSDISGSGTMTKVGGGELELKGTISASGTVVVKAGMLALDDDSRLGSTALPLNGGIALVINGGGIRYTDDFTNNLRAFTVGANGATLDNDGHDIEISNLVSGTGKVTFRGAGDVLVSEQMVNASGTDIVEGHVTGLIGHGNLFVNTGAIYTLGNQDQLVGQLSGGGNVEMGTHTLTSFYMAGSDEVHINYDGLLSGDGQFVVAGDGKYNLALSGANTYTGGTLVNAAVLHISSDANVANRGITLTGNGAIEMTQASSNLDITVDGQGIIKTGAGDLTLNGEILENGSPITLTKTGTGTLILNHDNNYRGTTVVSESGSYVALAHENGLGQSTLELSNGGGLKLLTDAESLRQINLAFGGGVINTNGYDGTVTLGLTGSGSLVKDGAGRLLIAADSNYLGSTTVTMGELEVGDGGTAGTLGGAGVVIEKDATLIINRAGTIGLSGDMSGEGHLVKTGTGLLELTTSNNIFNGSLAVNGGTVNFYEEGQLGRYPVKLDNRGGLELDSSLGLSDGIMSIDVVLGANGGSLVSCGSLDPACSNRSWTADGDITGTGTLYKTGTGSVILTGIAMQTGGTDVEAGTLQIGSALAGTLAGDVIVRSAGTLIFGRDDLTQYGKVISGDGTVIKRGAGELVLTGEQDFSGVFRVEDGNLRIGLGDTHGSLSGDVDLSVGTKLIFDRSDDSTFLGDSYGAGIVQKTGPGKLTVVGDVSQSGGTLINSGILQIGNGGTVGSIHNGVTTVTGAQLLINRSDNVVIDASVSGEGMIVQGGTGTTTLTGTNTQTGGVIVENGHLAIDSDARLGDSSGKLTLRNSGVLTYLQNFSLRDITLEPSGGGLDTSGVSGTGLDINYTGLITGSGNFIKEGLGRLTISRILVEGDLKVYGGELQLGDGTDDASAAATLGNAEIASGATLSLNRNGLVNFEGSLTGGGNFRQIGSSELRLPGDSSAFTGATYIDNGSLRLNGILGGDLNLAAGTSMQGTGSVLGDLVSMGATIKPGNSLGILTLGSLTLDAASTLEIEVNAANDNDKINVAGAATLAGTLRLIPLPGDYTVAGCCTYTIISAGSVSGTFDTVSNDLVFLNTMVDYQPTAVNVSFTRNNTSFNTVSLTWNQQQVSSAIDVMEVADAANPLALALSGMNADQARAAFDTLSGDSLLSAVNASARTARRFNHLLSSRSSRLGLASRGASTEPVEKSLAAVRAGEMPEAPQAFTKNMDPLHYSGPTSKVEGLWVEANGFKLTEDADDTVGSAASTFTGQLLALGMDGYWTDDFIVGFGAGYLQGNLGVDNRKSEADATGMFIGGYTRWETDSGWHYKGALTLGKQDSDQTRRGAAGVYSGTASSSAAVTSANAEFETGIALHMGNYGLRPYAIIDAQFLKRDAFEETGAGPANLQVAAATDVAGEFGAGVEISRPWLTAGARWAQIQAGLALLQPFGDTQRQQTVNFTGSGNSFTIKASPDDSAAIALTLGGEWYLSKSIAVWGGYEGRLSSTTQEHNAVLSFQYRW